uniref:Uncharacterized protein n=1 Tax=Schistocephalus solidus TaxID=70667 RepID=A0A0X3PVF3_SCHSO
MEIHNFPYNLQSQGSPESEYSEPSDYATSMKDKFGDADRISDSLSFLRCMRRRLENISRRIPSEKSAGCQKFNRKPVIVEGSGDLFSLAQNLSVNGDEDQLRVAQEEIETVLRTSLIGLRQASRLIKESTDGKTGQPTFSCQKSDPKVSATGCGKRKQIDEMYELPSQVLESPAKRSNLPARGLASLEEHSDPPVEVEAIAKCFRSLLDGLLEDKKMVCSSAQTSSFVSSKPAYTPPSPVPSMCKRREPVSDYIPTDSSSPVEPTGLKAGFLNKPGDRCRLDRRLADSQLIQQSRLSPEPLYRRSNATSKSDVFRMLTTIERSLELLAADVRQENSEIVDLICRSVARSRALEKDRIHRQPLPTKDQVFELKQAVEDLIYKVLFKRRKLKRLLRLKLKDCTLDLRSTADSVSSAEFSADISALRPEKPSHRKSSYTHSKKEISGREKSSVIHPQKMKLSREDPKYEILMALKVLRRDADRLISSLAVDEKRSSVRMPSLYGRGVRADSDGDI